MIPRIYGAVNAVATALSREGIAKERLNTRDDYLYRSIDDVLKRLSPLLAEHRICIFPRALERAATDRIAQDGEFLVSVSIKVALELVSAEDGSRHVIETWGEAIDSGDKGTAKAMQSAYKYALLQAFCVTVAAVDDADATSHRLSAGHHLREPREGWDRWAQDLSEATQKSRTSSDIKGIQEDRREELVALSRERPELYRQIGQSITERKVQLLEELEPRARKLAKKPKSPTTRGRRQSLKANGSAPRV